MEGEKMWYTVEQVAAMLEVHPQSVRRWIKAGTLNAYQLGDKAGYRIKAEDLERYMDARKVAVSET